MFHGNDHPLGASNQIHRAAHARHHFARDDVAGKAAGLVHLQRAQHGQVHVAAPDDGESPGGITQEHLPEAAPNLAPDSDGYLWVKPERFHDSFCQDLPRQEGQVMGVTQKAPLASTFGDVVSNPAWKNKPSWYQISSQDRMIHPDNQARMAKRLGTRETLTLDASHASLASRPAEVAAFIDKAACSLS